MRVLETGRLVLRPFAWTDFAAFHALAYADPAVAPWWTGRVRTVEEVRPGFARKVAQRAGAPGWLAVTRRDTGELAGGMGLQPWLPDEDTPWLRPEHPEDAPARDPAVLEVELAYVLGRAHWGHGYATEAGRAVLAYGFEELGVARVLSPINSANTRSIRLAQRLGCRIRRNLHPRPSPYRDAPGVLAVLTRAAWAAASDSPASD
jgi:RimJ/RimL family protein N-acetyltransferase